MLKVALRRILTAWHLGRGERCTTAHCEGYEALVNNPFTETSEAASRVCTDSFQAMSAVPTRISLASKVRIVTQIRGAACLAQPGEVQFLLRLKRDSHAARDRPTER